LRNLQTNPRPQLLIVDDEVHVCTILSRWLTAEGYSCQTAESAERAWELLQCDTFGLVVADIRLPGKSGLELLRMIQRSLPDVAVILVTAVDDRRTAIRALEMGAYGYIMKPFEENEVVISVVHALERRRLVLESQAYERLLEERVREQTREIRVSREEIALRLVAAQEYRHDETGAHIRRIGLYAEAMAQRMGHAAEEAEMFRMAAPMHDVGKIGIPDAILLKRGKLTLEERKIMETHTVIGGYILEDPSIPLLRVSRDVALCHHEKWDGSGYPRALVGEDIPDAARIVSILDVYDALVHDRVYRPAMSEARALDIICSGLGTQFAPKVFDVFLEALPELRRIRQRLTDRPR